MVEVIFDPEVISYQRLLAEFWVMHDPTSLNQQGGDIGTQYRSAIYLTNESQQASAISTHEIFQHRLTDAGFGKITTEIKNSDEFYYAEEYHQQYLAKNPSGYCGVGGTGVTCPVGVMK